MNINTTSFSQLKAFETCPRKYAEITVYRNFSDPGNEKTHYGSAVHSAIENHIRHGEPIPHEYGYAAGTINAILASSGQKFAEHEMAVRADLTPCDFHDSERWLRGIADLLIVPAEGNGVVARCADWKLGNSNYADTDQLEVMALLVFACFPYIQRVRGALFFLLEQRMFRRDVTRDEKESIWMKYRAKDEARLAAYHADNWTPKPSGLCRKHCPVTTCEHNGVSPGWRRR